MKTIIYVRVSTDKQEASEALQYSKCEQYCKMQGYDVVDVLIDSNVSGGTELFERPEGSKIKEYIESGKVEHIVSWKLDRLFRSAVNGLVTIDYFNKKNVSFSLIDMGGSIVDTSTPMGKFVTSTFLALGELEKDVTKDRVKKALSHRKENLKVYSGKTPYGFKAEGKDLIPVEEEMDVVRHIYNLKTTSMSYRNISNTVGLTLSKVHRIANDEFYERFL